MNISSDRKVRLPGLRRFAVAITALNILGHSFFGFEQSYLQPIVAVCTAYILELLFESIDATSQQRVPRFAGGVSKFIDFLLPAHITGLAVAMLLYANERLWVIAFASGVAIASKAIFRVPVGKGTRHFLNPSNFGITVTLLMFPWVGQVQPYHFTANFAGWGDWALPGFIIVSGSFLNARYTQRLPLIITWLSAFIAQAALRSVIFGTPIVAGLVPMTGVAFVLYTFYMVTDPATTPSKPRDQVLFGILVAATYFALMSLHIVFTLFFSLTIVCILRGIWLYVHWLVSERQAELEPNTPVELGEPVLTGATQV